MTGGLLPRAACTALGTVLLIPVILVVVPGYLPAVPVIGLYGALIVDYLAWLAVGAVGAAILCLAALRLGGGRLQRLLAAVAVVTLLATGLIVGQVLAFAASIDAPISIGRAFAVVDAGMQIPDSTATIATFDGTTLHAEIWKPSSGRASTRQAGAVPGGEAVIYVHGGAFVGGGLRNRPALFRFLADQGYPVIDIEYRLSPPARWNQATADVLCALGWVAGQASDLGIDPARIVLIGESAGGNLALMAAYGAGTTSWTSSCGGVAPRPVAVVAIAPTADLAALWTDNTIGAAGLRFPEAYIGGPPSAAPDRYRQASPESLVRPGLPPTLLITGSIDHLVHLGRTQMLASQLAAAGLDCSLVVVPYGDHGFDGPANAYGEQIEESILPRFIAAHTGGAAWHGPPCQP